MDYVTWREVIFGDPTMEPEQEIYELSPEENLEHVNRMLDDPEIHRLYSCDQIGDGLVFIYHSCDSEINRCYIRTSDAGKRMEGIRTIRNLYVNFFDRYCPKTIEHMDRVAGNKLEYLCSMLWDIFPLCHYVATPGETAAILGVLKGAIEMDNESCIASAIHGLGHWADDEPRAIEILQDWLQKPRTTNPALLEYAHEATTGMIL